MSSAAVAPLEVRHPTGWTWQTETRRYRNPQTGRFVSDDTVTFWRNMFIDRRQGAVRDLAQALAAGWVSIGSWREQMGEIQRETYGIMAALGRGGLAAMQPDDWERVNAQLAHQQPFLERFASEIEQGRLTVDQIGARSELYVGTSVQAFEAARAAAWGDPDLPELPGDGSTPCGGNCRCSWSIKATAVAWECTWHGSNDERTCNGCSNNQDRWAPLIIPFPQATREPLFAPVKVGTVTNTGTLTWTKTKSGYHEDDTGRFKATYENGWGLLDTQTGIRTPFRLLRQAFEYAEQLAKAGAPVVPPPVVPPPVIPTIVKPPPVVPPVKPVVKPVVGPPALGSEVEIKAGNGMRSGWSGKIIEIAGNWVTVNFGERGNAFYHITDLIVKANPPPPPPVVPAPTSTEAVIWNKQRKYFESSRNHLWLGAPRFELLYDKTGWHLLDNKTGIREDFKFQRDAKKRADDIAKTEGPQPTGPVIEPGAEVTVVAGGYRIGHKGVVQRVEKLGLAPATWKVYVRMTSGNENMFYGSDLQVKQPPPPAPPEVRVTADEAIRKIRNLQAEHEAAVKVLAADYTLAALAERSAMSAYLELPVGAGAAQRQVWIAAAQRRDAAKEKYETAQKGFLEKIRHEVLYHADPAQIKIEYQARWDPATRKEIDEQITAFRRMVGRGRLDGQTVKFLKTPRGRSFYVDDTVNLGKHLRAGATVVHELGHWLEERNSVAGDLIQADYDRRTVGETARSLRAMIPGSGYDPRELTKPDKFRSLYMGKVYPSYMRAHELLSMAIEQLYGDPIGLLTEDEASFRVVWEVLHSGPHVVDK